MAKKVVNVKKMLNRDNTETRNIFTRDILVNRLLISRLRNDLATTSKRLNSDEEPSTCVFDRIFFFRDTKIFLRPIFDFFAIHFSFLWVQRPNSFLTRDCGRGSENSAIMFCSTHFRRSEATLITLKNPKYVQFIATILSWKTFTLSPNSVTDNAFFKMILSSRSSSRSRQCFTRNNDYI